MEYKKLRLNYPCIIFFTEEILDRKRLKVVTGEYNDTIDFLKGRLTKVEQVLVMLNIYQNYDTFNDETHIHQLWTMNPDTEIPVDSVYDGVKKVSIEYCKFASSEHVKYV